MLKFETYDDAVYAHTDYVKFMREDGQMVRDTWLTDRDNKYGREASLPSAIAWQYALHDAVDTDVCWMSTEMMDLVQVAMETFDPSERVTIDDIFIPSGFLVLPHPFMSLDISGKKLAWRILNWKLIDPMVKFVNDETGEIGYTYDLSYEGTEEPGVRFMQSSWVWDDDDWTESEPEMTADLRSSSINWGIAHATAMPLRYMNSERETTGEGDHRASWLLFWRVAQRLMSERIVTSERQHPGRPARREAQRFQLPPPVLRVIELRRPRSEREGEAHGNGTRQYTHRWIVRGHWRNQWYPSQGRHKQKYIGEYVKGPEDLDLVVKQRVWNWDR